MHGVNLDLLQTGRHHADGRPVDPHAHHRAEHLAARRAARLLRWRALIGFLRPNWLPGPALRTVPSACPDQR